MFWNIPHIFHFCSSPTRTDNVDHQEEYGSRERLSEFLSIFWLKNRGHTWRISLPWRWVFTLNISCRMAYIWLCIAYLCERNQGLIFVIDNFSSVIHETWLFWKEFFVFARFTTDKSSNSFAIIFMLENFISAHCYVL